MDRSGINRRNATTHGLSYHPLYAIWQKLMRDNWVLMAPEWMEGGTKRGGSRAGLLCFIKDIEETIGLPPITDALLIVKRGSNDPVYRRDNVEWVEAPPRRLKRTARELKRKIENGELTGVPDVGVQCLCWIDDEPRCPREACLCDFPWRWECPCCVGILTRLGLFDDPELPEDL